MMETTAKNMNSSQKGSKNSKCTTKNVPQFRPQEMINKTAATTVSLNLSDSDTDTEEEIVWKEGYFGLTQNLNEKRGPKYKCTECLSWFNTRLSFFTHSQSHLKPFCILCGLYAYTKDEMDNHRINNHKQFIDIIKIKKKKTANITPLCEQLTAVENVSLVPSTNAKTFSKKCEKKLETHASPNGSINHFLIMKNTKYPIVPKAENINQNSTLSRELVVPLRANNSMMSIGSILLDQKNDFTENSSLGVNGSEMKAQRSSLKKNPKLKRKIKHQDDIYTITDASETRTKFSRSGRCITNKSFDY